MITRWSLRSFFSSLLRQSLTPAALGRRGEARAALYYRLRGYRVIDRNVRFRNGEIDLVVRRGRSVALVEVKTRQQRRAGEGFEGVDRAKEVKLASLADQYLAMRRFHDCEIRFDVVSLFWTGRGFELTCYPDAFCVMGEWGRPWRERSNKKGFRMEP